MASSLRTVLLGTLTALLSVVVALGSTPAPARAATPRCAPVYVFGARGSGEPIEGDPGKMLKPFISRLESLADPGSVGGQGLPYPAVSVYQPEGAFYEKSVRDGIANLVQLVKGRAAACKNEQLVLAGYSQGAQVVSSALPQLTRVSSHIGAVVLFGDPHFDPHSRAAQGSFSPKRHGILGLPAHDFPSEFPHVLSYCKGGDVICQGLPNLTTAHKQYAPQFTDQAAEKVADWLGLKRTRSCTPVTNVAAILDDSGSMSENDPLDIRAAAMQLLITEPTSIDRTLGAVEFGDEAGSLFPPGSTRTDQAGMLAALSDLRDDGWDGTGSDTNYNAALAASGAEQPGAEARIFLTDGEHNVGPFENGERGGPRTYVIGLNIGPSGEGNAAADLLGQIASETGGVYYPLREKPEDTPEIQAQRLQPVFNQINSQLNCQIAPSQSIRELTQVGAPAKPVGGNFLGNVGEQIVVSWTTPGASIGISSISVTNPGGRTIANLKGGPDPKGKKGRHLSRIAPLQTSTVSGATFHTVTVARPKHGSTIRVRVVAEALPAPTVVTVQLSPVETLPPPAIEPVAVAPTAGTPAAASAPAVGGPVSGPSPTPSPTPSPSPESPAPTPPQSRLEQETPNHPVNTFTNYHNASDMGPAIAAGQWVEVSCRVYDPTIVSVNPDGWWYRIASAPWSNSYYSPANTFMNGDPYGGPYTHNTDFSVPVC
ncbi:MAG TPA: cutinase family protein [Solirubrobacterales bacterium]|nr:cutinase family protein [Solirubrobacterales bacterium]